MSVTSSSLSTARKIPSEVLSKMIAQVVGSLGMASFGAFGWVWSAGFTLALIHFLIPAANPWFFLIVPLCFSAVEIAGYLGALGGTRGKWFVLTVTGVDVLSTAGGALLLLRNSWIPGFLHLFSLTMPAAQIGWVALLLSLVIAYFVVLQPERLLLDAGLQILAVLKAVYIVKSGKS